MYNNKLFLGFSVSSYLIKIIIIFWLINKPQSLTDSVTFFITSVMGCIFWIVSLTPILYLIWKYIHRKYDFFEERGLPYAKPTPIFGNSFKLMFKLEALPELMLGISNKFRTSKFVGFFDFREPSLVIQDPDMIKQIGVKDFENFVNHQLFATSDADELFVHSLFLMKDQRWKDMRGTLSPAFTGSKMRMMFELVRDCANSGTAFLKDKCDSKGYLTIDAKEIFSQITVNVISTCAFGLEVDCLRNPKNEVFEKVKKIFSSFESFASLMKFLLMSAFPKIIEWLNIPITPIDCSIFFKKLVSDTIQYRKNTNTFRPDVIQLLIQAMEGKLHHETDKQHDDSSFAAIQESEIDKRGGRKNWTDIEIAAQCFIFFTAGYETTSTLLAFAAIELAINEDVQEKLYQEIASVKKELNGGAITYEALQKMQYLDAFICEALRKHPPVVAIDRVCNKDTLIDDGNGQAFMIPKDMTVQFNTIGLHYNPKYFSNPDQCDPERFLGENKSKIKPYTYMPFGVGPRACIGKLPDIYLSHNFF